MNRTITITILIIVLVGLGIYALSRGKDKTPPTTEQTTTETTSQPPTSQTSTEINIDPLSHATMVLTMANQVIYTDPVGGQSAFEGKPAPSIILITDIHGDHLNLDTLKAISKPATILIAPEAVANQLTSEIPGAIVVLKNGETTEQKGLSIEAVPMYNVPETADARHTKGRGNGYVLEALGKRVYISGDTGNTPEMQNLQNIDIAFICMNPPFTMNVEDAASATLTFKPKRVIPYHYRGQDGLNDTNKFKQIVNAGDPNIQVDLVDFYPEN